VINRQPDRLSCPSVLTARSPAAAGLFHGSGICGLSRWDLVPIYGDSRP
jgi:hypothetical protein